MSAAAEHTDHEHGHHPKQAHHFHSMEQQRGSSKMGMWLFLGNELLFFAGLFMAYIFLRWSYPDMWLNMSHHLDVTLGTINTVALLTSSLTMVLAVRAAKLGDNKQVVRWLAVTIFLALAFCVIKAFEYKAKFEHGLLPANFWDGGVAIQQGQAGPWLFFGLYFGMTGLHALHVIIGIGVLAWILVRAMNEEFDSEHYSAVDNVGLYWHLVDLIWIFLFPLLYLVE
jgi:cytochrome c oxidase subunit 3